jgi:hypothetical protein
MPSKVIVRLEVRFPLLLSYFALPAAGNTTPDYLVNRPALAFLFHLFQLECDLRQLNKRVKFNAPWRCGLIADVSGFLDLHF